MSLQIRRLVYSDLPHVVAIERRAFPAPWSLGMFVLELSKPGGVCLAAFDGDQARLQDASGDGAGLGAAIAGYLICSRYDTVWHIMNVAVDPDRRRQGVATALLGALLERIDDPRAQYTLEVRKSNEGAMALYERLGFAKAGLRRRYYQDNGEDAVIMWRTPATLRGSLDDVPNAASVIG